MYRLSINKLRWGEINKFDPINQCQDRCDFRKLNKLRFLIHNVPKNSIIGIAAKTGAHLRIS